MTPEETGRILGEIALCDNRKVDVPMVAQWHRIIGDLPYSDTSQAVIEYFAESTEYLKPADLIRRVKTIRADRLRNSDLVIPAGDPDDREAWAQSLRTITNRLANGREPFRAIEGIKGKTAPSKAYRDARSAEDSERVLGQTIACPVDWCGALAGQPCVSQVHGKPLAKGHPSRLKAARSEAS